jgi:LPS export ABC transporter permease LptG
MIVAVPASNQLFREITFPLVASRAEGEVKPRVFFDDFPHLVLYAREVPLSGGGWQGVFLSDTRPGTPESLYLAREGRVHVDREARTVELALYDGSRHTMDPDGYRVFQFDRIVLSVDPSTVFPSEGTLKGFREMTIAELRGLIDAQEAEGLPTHNERMAIQQKFAIPVACLVFGIIGLALGATNRRDGALGSFGLGLLVVFTYYIPLNLFPQMTKGGYVPPWLAVWLPNMILGTVAVLLFVWRNRVADQPIRIPLPIWLTRAAGRLTSTDRPIQSGRSPVRLLDRYIGARYIRIMGMAAGAALAVFYISSFLDLSDKLFKGQATWQMLGAYFWYATPQFVYYVLPVSVLIAALVTVGALTRSSELVVMKACGISLYRVAAPMLLCAGAVGLLLFVMDATVLGTANRRAEALRGVMRGGSPIQPNAQPWVAGTNGTVYHVSGYDPLQDRFHGVEIFEFDAEMSRLTRRMVVERARPVGTGEGAVWELEGGWTREFEPDGSVEEYADVTQLRRELETAAYFAQEPPDSRFMSYAELKQHSRQLRASGFDVVEHEVGVARKLAYPFVTVIMTLIAVPFAITLGRSGTMAGLAAGIGLAIVYWGTINFAAALGAGGALAPMLAAWAPNMLFGAGAAYLLLTVRT